MLINSSYSRSSGGSEDQSILTWPIWMLSIQDDNLWTWVLGLLMSTSRLVGGSVTTGLVGVLAGRLATWVSGMGGWV